MAEYIDAEKIEYPYMTMSMWGLNSKDCHSYNEGIKAVEDKISAMPAADVVEVKHGYWIKFVDECDCEYIECSCCGNDFYDGDNDTYDILPKYCCECGAKMDGERKENEQT